METEPDASNNNSVKSKPISQQTESTTNQNDRGQSTGTNGCSHGMEGAKNSVILRQASYTSHATSSRMPRGSLCSSIMTDSASISSKTSRSSRFFRKLSVRRSKAGSWFSAKLRKHQKGNDLSAAFNLLDQENKGALVNLNTATEEELMTVSGITRVIAHSIVEYRTAIGGFRQLQDLALVSGVGAARMTTLCKDLTIMESSELSITDGTPAPSTPSICSAPTPSIDANHRLQATPFSTPPFSTPTRPPTSNGALQLQPVNINTASMFELMTIPGMNQEMAANIVHYREKKGCFKTVQEVTKVRGMRLKFCHHILPHLTIASVASHTNLRPTSDSQPLSVPSRSKIPGHRRTLSAPPQNNGRPLFADNSTSAPIPEKDSTVSHRLSLEFSSDVYDLLSLRSERPEIHGLFENSFNGKSAARFATWNLSKLTQDKINNPGVLEVVCRTILERGFTIVALQDLLGQGLVDKISCELNNGTLRRVREWPGKRGSWSNVQSKELVASYAVSRSSQKSQEFSSFLYNENFVQLKEESILETGLPQHFVTKPHVAKFLLKNVEFYLVNIHVRLQNKLYGNEHFSPRTFLDLDDSFQSALDINFGDEQNVRVNSTSEDPVDLIKSAKNLHNGLIKDNIVALGEDLNRSSLRGSSRSEGSRDNSMKRRLHFSTSSDNSGLWENIEHELQEVLRIVYAKFAGEKVLVMGDFAGLNEVLETNLTGFTSVVATDRATVVGDGSVTSQCSDNIWSSNLSSSMYTGVGNVVREGLTHLAIPKGWGWGGLATSHCPVYGDFYTEV